MRKKLETDVFHALADPTRRQILDRLRVEGPLSVKEIAAPMTMSRQAATKHLDVLASAGLLVSVKRGRERRHLLQEPALETVHEWLRPYAEAWDRRLERLEQHLET